MESYRESRRDIRFPVEARIIYKWVDESGGNREGEVRTLNISERGAFVSSQEHPPRGTTVHLKIFLARIPITPSRVTILMDATVIRIDEGQLGQSQGGFAVEGQATQLVGLHEM